MKYAFYASRIGLLLILSAPAAFAAEVDFITYAPAQQTGGNQHVNSLTVGSAYNSATPGDGTALILSSLGIGTTAPGLSNAWGSTPILTVNGTTQSVLELAGSRSSGPIGEIGFLNELNGTADDRIAQISGAVGSANNSGELRFTTWDAGTAGRRMTITSAGNVCIGTTNPQYGKLEVANPSSGDVTRALTLTNFGATANGTGSKIRFLASRSNGDNQEFSYIDSVVTDNRIFSEDGRLTLGTMVNGNLTDTLTATSGSVGIGTTSPGAGTKLHVHDSLTASQYITTNGANPAVLWFGNNYDNAGARRWAAIGVTGTDDALRFTGGNSSLSDADTHMIITNTGLVGIGTTNPEQGFGLTEAVGGIVSRVGADPFVLARPQVRLYRSRGTNAAPAIVVKNDELGLYRFAGYDGTQFVDGAFIGASVDGTPGTANMPGRLSFLTNPGAPDVFPLERMRITSAGRVGIGTTNPGAKLEVAGDAKITGGLEPDYDSGWVSDSNKKDHQTTFSHNLSVIPTRITIWFATSNNPSTVYPLTWSWSSTNSGNPVTIEVTTTQVVLNIYSGSPLHGIWNGSTGSTGNWTHFNSGYWRVLCWK